MAGKKEQCARRTPMLKGCQHAGWDRCRRDGARTPEMARERVGWCWGVDGPRVYPWRIKGKGWVGAAGVRVVRSEE